MAIVHADTDSVIEPAAAQPGAGLACVAALTLILDLANGVEEESSQRTAAFAWHLASEAGLSPADRGTAFMAGLLYHIGCTAFASTQARFADDDIALRAALGKSDRESPRSLVWALLRANQRAGSRIAALIDVGLHHADIRDHWMREACGAARSLATHLGCTSATLTALGEMFERWDGRGGPHGLRGDALSVPGRVMQAAHVAVLFHTSGGTDVARRALAQAARGTLDPVWAARAESALQVLDTPSSLALAWSASESLAAAAAISPFRAAEVFGEFADLQTPHTRGHSAAVARLAHGAGVQLGLAQEELVALDLAAHLHDVGHVALPTALWMQTRPWSDNERRRAQTHVSVTERVLAQAPVLQEAARIAGAHHERLDGSGYPRGARQSQLERPSRLLAVVEMTCNRLEDRPHRRACSVTEVALQLVREANEGRLDAACVDVVQQTLGQPRQRTTGAGLQLTEREVDVLRPLATGQTNKQIARALGISDRTVQTHTQHIYAKLGVDTRAGAALAAARAGLL
ncbi:MAG TPA: HD domain-containing phosphohydrolase [Polaromonas sp.]|uniref:HD domain-containing phosphohydrolase n=1 Tax=Polaromonas sp. TaxID=1869339 RepID=UPI002D64BE92|nr:HD domain-containing phosphohydrolase [Polaromonas sp.]HYW57160.1 HD domain-containing phosphohydrolase [Polaromonas sp.]